MLQLGVIGLGTMGANLARNAARNGAEVVVFNRTTEKTDTFMKNYAKEGSFVASHSLEDFVKALSPSRAILLMVKAGEAVDDMINELLPLLTTGDIIIDAGNSHYRDTVRREAMLKEKGIAFIGMGVSGGEEGALKGPSMMPGGDKDALEKILPLLEKMAADDANGGKCVTYIGPGGAGHFVKMVHNGIEYALMQLIAEAYHVLKSEVQMSNRQLGETFTLWNESQDLQSFLMEITAAVFKKKDADTGKDIIDLIKDTASQKGTGKWTVDAAMEYGVAIPTITAAVDARILSGSADLRSNRDHLPAAIEQRYPEPQKLLAYTRTSLALSTIIAYVQGFELLLHANSAESWNLNLSEIARIWRGGCIIRSSLLPIFEAAYGDREETVREAKAEILRRFDGERQRHWRRAVAIAIGRGIPMPATASALSYYDAIRADRLPQNLVQAQRDMFGAHGFETIDKTGIFHF